MEVDHCMAESKQELVIRSGEVRQLSSDPDDDSQSDDGKLSLPEALQKESCGAMQSPADAGILASQASPSSSSDSSCSSQPPVLTQQILEDHEVPDLPDTLTLTLMQQKSPSANRSSRLDEGEPSVNDEEGEGMRSNESLLEDITELLLEHNEQSHKSAEGSPSHLDSPTPVLCNIPSVSSAGGDESRGQISVKDTLSNSMTRCLASHINTCLNVDPTALSNSSHSKVTQNMSQSSACVTTAKPCSDQALHPLLATCGQATVFVLPDITSRADPNVNEASNVSKKQKNMFDDVHEKHNIKKKKSSKHKDRRKNEKNDLKQKAWKSRLKADSSGKKKKKEERSYVSCAERLPVCSVVNGSSNCDDHALTGKSTSSKSHSVSTCVPMSANMASVPIRHTSTGSHHATVTQAPVKRKPGRPPKKTQSSAANNSTVASLQKRGSDPNVFNESSEEGRHDSRVLSIDALPPHQADAMLRLDHISSNRSPDSGIVSINGSPADQDQPPSPLPHTLREHFEGGVSSHSDQDGPPVLENMNEVSRRNSTELSERPILEPAVCSSNVGANSVVESHKRQRKTNTKYSQDFGVDSSVKHKTDKIHVIKPGKKSISKMKRPVGRPRKHPLPDIIVKPRRGRPKGSRNVGRPKGSRNVKTLAREAGHLGFAPGMRPWTSSSNVSYWGMAASDGKKTAYKHASATKALSQHSHSNKVASSLHGNLLSDSNMGPLVTVKRKRGRPRKNPLPEHLVPTLSVIDPSRCALSSAQHSLSISVASSCSGSSASKLSVDSCSSSSSLGPPVLSPALSPIVSAQNSHFPFTHWGVPEKRSEQDLSRTYRSNCTSSKSKKSHSSMQTDRKKHQKKCDSASLKSQPHQHISPHISSSTFGSSSALQVQQSNIEPVDNVFSLPPRVPMLTSWGSLAGNGLLNHSHAGGLAATTMLALSSLEQDVTPHSAPKRSQEDKQRQLLPGAHSPGIKFCVSPTTLSKDVQMDLRSDDSSCGKRKKKKSKHFKSKHKNIVDPVFLAEIENLNSDMQSLTISEVASSTCDKEKVSCFGSVTTSPLASFSLLKQSVKASHKSSNKDSSAIQSTHHCEADSHANVFPSDSEQDSAEESINSQANKKFSVNDNGQIVATVLSPAKTNESSVISRMENALSSTMTKRGPGRPRKHPVVTAVVVPSKIESSPGTKKRGRPKLWPNKTDCEYSVSKISVPAAAAVPAVSLLPSTDDSSSDSEPEHPHTSTKSIPLTKMSSQSVSPKAKMASSSVISHSSQHSPKASVSKACSKAMSSPSRSAGKSSPAKLHSPKGQVENVSKSGQDDCPQKHHSSKSEKKAQKSRKKKKKSKKEGSLTKKNDGLSSKKESKKHKKKKRKSSEKHSHDGIKRKKASSDKCSVEVSTETERAHGSQAVHADSEIQVDLDEAKNPKKRRNVDVGIQVDPAEMMMSAGKAHAETHPCSEVGTQASNEDSNLQPLEIQVDFCGAVGGLGADKSTSSSNCSSSSKQSSVMERWISPQVPSGLYQTVSTSPRSPLLMIQRHLACQSLAPGCIQHPVMFSHDSHYPMIMPSIAPQTSPKPALQSPVVPTSQPGAMPQLPVSAFAGCQAFSPQQLNVSQRSPGHSSGCIPNSKTVFAGSSYGSGSPESVAEDSTSVNQKPVDLLQLQSVCCQEKTFVSCDRVEAETVTEAAVVSHPSDLTATKESIEAKDSDFSCEHLAKSSLDQPENMLNGDSGDGDGLSTGSDDCSLIDDDENLMNVKDNCDNSNARADTFGQENLSPGINLLRGEPSHSVTETTTSSCSFENQNEGVVSNSHIQPDSSRLYAGRSHVPSITVKDHVSDVQPMLSIPVKLPLMWQSTQLMQDSSTDEDKMKTEGDKADAHEGVAAVVISPSSDSENNEVQITSPPPSAESNGEEMKGEPDNSICVILDSEHDVIVVDDDDDDDDDCNDGFCDNDGDDSCTEVIHSPDRCTEVSSKLSDSRNAVKFTGGTRPSAFTVPQIPTSAHRPGHQSSKRRAGCRISANDSVRSDSECVVVVDRLGEDELRRHQVVLPDRLHKSRNSYLTDSDEEEQSANNNHKVSKLAKKRFYMQQKNRRHSDPESCEIPVGEKTVDVSSMDQSMMDAGQLPEADQGGYAPSVLDQSLDTTAGDTTTDEHDISICSLTSSECDVLAISHRIAIKKKKRRPLQDDMGYSRPKRKRRKKKKDSSLNSTRDSAIDEYHPLGCSFTEYSEMDTADEGDYCSAASSPSYMLGTPGHAPGTPSYASTASSLASSSSSIACSTPSHMSSGYPSSVSGASTPVRISSSTMPAVIVKKRYQKAGLYSNSYKEDQQEKAKKLSKKEKVYVPSDHEHGLLPPPIHCGRYMREKRIDFRLPFDIWYLHTHHMLQPHKMPSPKYRKIRNNVYIDAKPVCRDWEPHACTCKPPAEDGVVGCGDNCLNRMVYTECTSNTCPCGQNCDNQRIQQHRWTNHLEKFLTADRGYGVRCTDGISHGQMISEYVGEVVSEEEFKRRMTDEYASSSHHYCLHLDAGTVIDGYRAGNITRFVNHSCHPNCEMQKWNVNGVYRIALFAMRDIPSGEELTYDYNFHCFNMEAQQICMCGSENCRGVVGGKGQRINTQSNQQKSQSGSHVKDKRKSKNKTKKSKDGDRDTRQATPVKPMSHRERCFAQKHAIFLLRNIQRVKQQRHNNPAMTDQWTADSPISARATPTNSSTDVFKTQYTALKTSRSVRTRGLALAEEHVEVIRVARLAQVLRHVFSTLISYKDETGLMPADPLMHVPSKRRNPDYYQLIEEPIDLHTIEKNILSGSYNNLDNFDHDINLLFKNVELYCGKKSDIGEGVSRLRKVYGQVLETMSGDLEEVLGPDSCSLTALSQNKTCETDSVCDEPTPAHDRDESSAEQANGGDVAMVIGEEEDEEEVIRCVCNIYRDEGLMIQCDKCQMWQHCDCMGVSKDVEHYTCEMCDPRYISPEVAMVPQPSDALPGCSYFMTLMREDGLQVRIGECVYVLREGDQHSPDDSTDKQAPYPDNSTEKLDIFRVEQLWKNENEEKFALGHYYFRPRETFHEPSRKFFPNEVFRVPIYEIVPLDTVIGRCCVMDLPTFCKGRPKGIQSEDAYICEYRLDKTAHFFYKIVRTKWPINTKKYCFNRFEKRLQPRRTFSPHEVPDQYKKKGEGEGRPKSSSTSEKSFTGSIDSDEDDLPLSKVKALKIEEKKARVNEIMNRLLAPIPVKLRVDASYLLEGVNGKRVRKKTTLCSM